MMNHYLLFKSVHLLGVVLFLGNIIVTGWWKIMADRHGDPIVVSFAQRQITLTDFAFTAAGAALVTIGAVANVMRTLGDYSFTRDSVIPETYWRLNRQWVVWGTMATLLPFSNLYWMVFKPI